MYINHYHNNSLKFFTCLLIFVFLFQTLTIPSYGMSITHITRDENNNITITFESEPDMVYTISTKDNFIAPYGDIDTITATDTTTEWTDDGTNTGSHPTNVNERYYKVTDNRTDSENIVGMVKVTVDEGMNLISLPLVPQSNKLEDVIGDQVTGADNESAADRLWMFNGTNYEFAWLVQGVGPGFDGKWYTGNEPTSITFDADQGAWLQVRPGHGQQDVFLLGEVSQTDREIPLDKGMNLVGSAYPVPVPLTETNLWESGMTGADNESEAARLWTWLSDHYEFYWLVDGVNENFNGMWFLGNEPVERNLEPGKGYWIQVRQGQEPFMWTYLNPLMVTVPDCIGVSQNEAVSSIVGAELTVGAVTTAHSAAIAAGHVMNQSPAGGASVEKGSYVDLVISLGPATVKVPDVIGMAQAEAEAAIVSANLIVGAVTTEYSDTVPEDHVISQEPSGGTTVSEGAAVNLVISLGPDVPPDPADVAPEVDPTVATTVYDSTKFIYEGDDPIQTGVAPGTIELTRAVALRGKVLGRDNNPLSGVTITIHNHPEYGQTQTRPDGMFDMVVNGGGVLTVNYQKDSFLPAQRQIKSLWQEYVWLPDVVMIPYDDKVTAIDLTSNEAMQAVQGSIVTDNDGTRQATLFIPQGTSAEMVMPDGSTQPITTLHIRATEYTVGENGPEAMPAALPLTSFYTYAVEYSVDEAVAAGAKSVHFNQPVFSYVENFLDFPVGTTVPTGYYDKDKGQWVPLDSGLVIKILGINNDKAEIDSDGDEVGEDTESLEALGIYEAEQEKLALLYSPGESLWRVPLVHLTPIDKNFGIICKEPCPTPDVRSPKDPDIDEPSQRCGSIIDCQNQSLGEEVDISGTPFSLNYQSSRTLGGGGYSRNIQISGESISPTLRKINLELEIAGQKMYQSFERAPNLETLFTWDGKDAYGRILNGRQPMSVQIDYEYEADYGRTNIFSGFPPDAVSVGSGRIWTTSWRKWREFIGGWDARTQGLGGWTINVHHSYTPIDRTLYLGDGRRRSVLGAGSIITRAAGSYFGSSYGEGGPATQAFITPTSLAVGADNSLYFPEVFYDYHTIRRVDPDGIITTVAGSLDKGPGYSGDGGLAAEAQLNNPRAVECGPDGSLYIGDNGNYVIRRVDPNGIITTIAGNGTRGFNGDGGPATEAQLIYVKDIAVSPDGSIYFSGNSKRVRRVSPDGIIDTVAGREHTTGLCPDPGDGGPADQACLYAANSYDLNIAIGPDGSLYIGECIGQGVGSHVRKVSLNGIITSVAGNGVIGYSGDGDLATDAEIGCITGLEAGTDGSLYIADWDTRRIRWVNPENIITTIAGTGFGFSGDGGPATDARFGYITDIALGPDNSLYISDIAQGSSSFPTVRKVGPALPGLSLTESAIPSEDGSEVYIFSSTGKHLRTLHALTGAVMYEFTYDDKGWLTQIEDGDGNVTTIERDNDGSPTALIAPFGQRTELRLNANGYLEEITNPAGESFHMTYSGDGLMQTLTDPRENTHDFTYDDNGRLIRDKDPDDGLSVLTRTEIDNGYEVNLTTAMSRTTTYRVEDLPTGEQVRVNIFPDSTESETKRGTNGSTTVTLPDSTTRTVIEGPDPRFKMLAPLLKSQTITTPGGRILNSTMTRSTTLTDSNDPLSLVTQTDTTTINDHSYTSTYDASSRTFTNTTPEGRHSKVTIDEQGRVVLEQVPGILPIQYGYDEKGRLNSIIQGTDPDTRTITLSYNNKGYLENIIDPLNNQLRFTHNAAGRVTTQTLPDTSPISYGYDKNGNVISVTPPGQPAHTFAYTLWELLSLYTPPEVGQGNYETEYSYNKDHQLKDITRPDGKVIHFSYDNAGRLDQLVLPREQLTYNYSPLTGQLAAITASDNSTLSFTYDGSLLTTQTWTGEIAGSIEYEYNNDLSISSLSVNKNDPITFTYDDDGLLTQTGALSLNYDSQNGILTGTTLSNMADQWTYNDFGEPISYAATYDVSEIFAVQYTRDKLGRIKTKTETTGEETHTYTYIYDLTGRLAEVMKNDVSTATYGYDSNGNRLFHISDNGTVNATCDEQDRLLQYGNTTYSYTDNGELLSKTAGSQTTTYDYDVLGNLRAVTLPDGTQIDYLIDGQNRRIGKKINDVLVQGVIYQDSLNPIAELDDQGAVVSRFVYSTREHVPDYLIKNGITYRILSDHLGSPRLVVNTITGEIVQRLDYDEFGNILLDTNSGLQPFGFAGGIYDSDTGLVRFGARDYDPKVGRWTAKDPLLFDGGQTNFYLYAGSDPINRKDPNGLFDWFEAWKWLIAGGIGVIVPTLGIALWAKVTIVAIAAFLAAGLKKDDIFCDVPDLKEIKIPSIGEPPLHRITRGMEIIVPRSYRRVRGMEIIVPRS